MQAEPRATFTDMKASTAEDWAIIASQRPHLVRDLPHQLLNHIKLMDGDYGGFPVDRLQHSLLTATLANVAVSVPLAVAPNVPVVLRVAASSVLVSTPLTAESSTKAT